MVDALASLGIDRCHLVGASFGAGVALEVALTKPALVESLLLAAPGGSLICEATRELRTFFEAERSALARDDLEGAVEANLAWWVDGPHRDADAVDRVVREKVGEMQRQAFVLTAAWGDVPETELDPPASERLEEIQVRTLVLVGALDIDAIADTGQRLAEAIPDVRHLVWPDTAHLPTMERPDDFTTLLHDWLSP